VSEVTVEVRAAATTDEDALAALDGATWSALSSPGPAPPATRPFFDDRAGPDSVLVATAHGAVVGYVRLEPPTRLSSNAHVLQITGIAVDSGWQGLGVGRALVEGALARASARGARRVTLRVLAPNERARRLYERCGFTVEGVLRGEFRLDGLAVDDVLMAIAV